MSDEFAWPAADGPDSPVVFVTSVSDRLEFEFLKRWLQSLQAERGEPDPEILRFDSGRDSAALAALESRPASCWIQPVGVAWLALESHEPPSLLKDFFYGRRVQPGPIRRRWLARHRPDRIAYVTGEGVRLETIRLQWTSLTDSGKQNLSFGEHIAYQSELRLEQAERQLRGARYRIARLRPAVVFANREFEARLQAIAVELNRPIISVRQKAAAYLGEMAASQTPFTLDLLMGIFRLGCQSNHDPRIDVRPEQIDKLRQLIAKEAVTFQITHKSMLDTVAFSLIMFEANLPVPLTFGGINLKTFGVGALARRAGVIFLRRSFQNNQIYKSVFRRYIDHLIERRFSVLWALEGGRSRTGKLMPPRYGLFNYVLESSLRTGNSGLFYVPVAVAYDQITEVDDYANEQRGRDKKTEGMGWMLRFFKRGGSHGKIYVRFGEPYQLADVGELTANEGLPAKDLSAPLSPEVLQELVRKLAFESANRLNAAMPVTVPAILALILLASGRRAQPLGEIQTLARSGAALLRRRKVEIVGNADFRDIENVRVALNQLNKTRVVSYFDEGLERLYRIETSQHHAAAYYRNTVIHHVLLDAIAEVALLQCRSCAASTIVEQFFHAGESLRELFLFEFFFPPRADFRRELGKTVESKTGNWEVRLREEGASALLDTFAPLFAHGVLRSFVDAYRVLAAHLVREENRSVRSDGSAMTNMMKLGRQMLLQEVIFSSESVSKSLFESAFQAAGSKGLLAEPEHVAEPESDNAAASDLLSRRLLWLRELQQLSKQLDQIMLLNLSRGVNEFR